MSETEDQGKAAYEGFLNGMSWPDLAKSFGFLGKNKSDAQRVRGFAERYAKRSGLRWPIASCGRRPKPERQEMGKICYELRQEGKSWQDVAAITGISERWSGRIYKVSLEAKYYAERNGLLWPLAEKKLLKKSKDEDDRAAYVLRLPSSLKAEAEKRAAADRMSLNAWITEAIKFAANRAGDQ